MAAQRNFSERFSTNTTGDILLIGNTSMSCDPAAANCNAARSATGGVTNVNNNDFNMYYVDETGARVATATTSAILNMPGGSTVLWAGLYWGGEQPLALRTQRDQVNFRTPASGFVPITASQDDYEPDEAGTCTIGGTSYTTPNGCDRYSAFAEVTNLVKTGGNGTYTVSDVKGAPAWGTGKTASTYAGWTLVVVLQNNTLPTRNLSVFDGYKEVGCNSATSVDIPVSGFITPYSGPVLTRMGVIAGEGDLGSAGQENFKLQGTALTDPVRQLNNFFNASISDLGTRVTTGSPPFNNQLGWDIARINASGILANGATSATMNISTNTECYYASAITFATDLYVPIIVPNVSKVAVDLNGGNLVPGDILRYTITMNNTGYDTGTNLSVIDNIPPYTSYVPNSLRIVSGPAGAPTGAMSDASSDDAAEYIATGTPRVVIRLGSGANATNGGNLALGQSTSLSFDVQLDATIPVGTILTNTAQISYSGQTLGAVYAAASSAAASAVFVPPAVTKAFSPQVVADSTGTSTLSIVFTNPASNLGAATGVAVTDTYPSGLINATPAIPSLTCTPGSTAGSIVGGVAGGNTIGMTGTTIAQNGSCTLSVTVKGTVNGIFTNNLAQVTTTNAGSTTTPAATAVFSVGRPTISKAFSASSILTGGTAAITFTLANPTASPFTAATFTDLLPSGLTFASAPVSQCGGTNNVVLSGSPVNTLTMTDGTIPATGNCAVTAVVTSSTAGSYNNTSSGVITTQTPTVGAPSNTASLLVYAPVTATKAFTPISVSTGGVSQLAITVSNPNPAGMPAVTSAAFTDNYPASLFNSAAPTPVITCTAGSSGSITAGTGIAGGGSIGMSGGTLASGGSCTITVFVTSSIANNYTDNADTITTTNAGSGTVPAATLNVSAFTPPGTTKSFTGPIARNQASVMTITLTNANASDISGVSFTDSYPSGLVNTATPGGATTCTGGTVTAVAGGNSLSLSGAAIPTSGCTVTVNVTSANADTYFNNTGLITTGNAGIGAGASGSLQVLAPPVIAKTFATNPVALNTASKMTITLTNPPSNTAALTGVTFTDTFPVNNAPNGMKTAPTPNLNNTCGGTVTGGAAGNTSLGLSNVTLAASASCIIEVNVIGATADNYLNSTGTVNSTNAGNGNIATATLSVGQPGISKTFGTSPIMAGAVSLMTITLSNPTGAAMTAAAFSDSYPAGMVNATPLTLGGTCAGRTVDASTVAGGGVFNLTSATIPANNSCTVTVNVTATVTGTNTIPAGALTVSGGASNVNPASAILTVIPPPVATKSFSPASISTSASYAAGDELIGKAALLSITITNPTSNTINGVAFTDTYPSANLDNSVASTINCTAGSSGTRTGGAGASTVGMTGGILLGNGSCTVTVPVFSNTAGTYNNTTGPITSTDGGTGLAAAATLTVLAPFTAAKTFSPSSVNITPDSSVLTITLNNPNATTAVTGASFTDTYPASLVNTTPVVTSTTCGGTVTAVAGGGSLALSGGTIPADSSCTVTVVVAATTAGNKTNLPFTISSSNDGTASVAAATLTLVAYTAPGVTKTFSAGQINVGASTTMTVTLTNPNSGSGIRDITGTAFTDILPTEAGGVQMKIATGAQSNTCGGTLTANVNSSTVSLSGGTIPEAGSCQITVPVTSTAPGTYLNTINTVTSGNAATGGPASATLIFVLAVPTVTKTFTPASVPVNSASTMTITLTSPAGNGANDITGVNFSDTFPAVVGPPAGLMVIAAPLSNFSNSCGGTVTANAGDTSLSLTNGIIPSSVPRTCTITVDVMSATGGSYLNSIDYIYSNNAPTQSIPGSDTLTVISNPSLTIVKSAVPTSAKPGEIITYTIDVNNNAGPATTVTLTDTVSPNTALRLKFNDAGLTPFEFTPNTSGLTLGPISYSSNNGTDFLHPLTDQGGGFDGSVTNWKIIMNNTMNQGSSDFTLRYQMKIK